MLLGRVSAKGNFLVVGAATPTPEGPTMQAQRLMIASAPAICLHPRSLQMKVLFGAVKPESKLSPQNLFQGK